MSRTDLGRIVDRAAARVASWPPERQRAITSEEELADVPVRWGDAIWDAHNAVGAAHARRAAVLRAANEAGVSTRQIASVLGVSPATAWRWLGEK